MPIDRTHDILNIPYHVKDVKALGDLLNSAAAAAFPNQGSSRYKAVHALLLTWEDDNLGVINEVDELEVVFRQTYHFKVEKWKIPSKRPHNTLAAKLLGFLEDFESKDNLLIIYYGGHGSMNDDRQCVWSCTEEKHCPEVQWYGLQIMLEQARSDVLILLDCCAAASSATSSGNGITEIIAACGFEAYAPGVGQHSFTRSLIDELKYLEGMGSFSTSLLHDKVLSRVKYWKPRFGPSASRHEIRRTPIYIVISSETRSRSIVLEPLRPQEVIPPTNQDASSASSIPSSAFSSLPISVDQASTSEISSKSSTESVGEVWPDQNFNCPKVHISIALEEEQWLSPQHWADWIRSVPALVKFASIEGIYKSDSTLIMVSIPIAIWNLVPANPAITFVGFVKSENLLSSNPFESDATVQRVQLQATAPGSTGRRIDNRSGEKDPVITYPMQKEAKDLVRELQMLIAEANRAWERLGRVKNEERQRIQSLRNGESTLVGGITVVPTREDARGMPKKTSNPDSIRKFLPGRPGNLTTEQEAKLKELWIAVLRLFGVATPADGLNESDSPEKVKAEVIGSAKEKKKRVNIFSKKTKADSSNGTVIDGSTDANDKWGQTKGFHNVLANQSPEDIRRVYWSMVKHDHPDGLILRFLRARKWDVQRALVMMVATMHWRSQEMHVDDDIMSRGEVGAFEDSQSANTAVKKEAQDFLAHERLGKSFIHGTDREGRPMCFVRTRLHRQDQQGEASLERYMVFVIETARLMFSPPVDTATIVFDMTDLSVTNLDYSPLKFMIDIFEANYPESLGLILVHRSPWTFQGIWNVIKGWLDPVVASKVHFTKNVEELEASIEKGRIIKELGGNDPWQYQFVEPRPGENDQMKDEITKQRLLDERAKVVEEFEKATQDWIKGFSVTQQRTELAERLRLGYWQLDPYLRSRSLYDRTGVIQKNGNIEHYAATAVDGPLPAQQRPDDLD